MTADALPLPGLEPEGPYRMELRRADGWEPMDKGRAAKAWGPRPTVVLAVAKCLAWAGIDLPSGTCIPQMRVVDVGSDRVVWTSGAYLGGHVPDLHDHVPGDHVAPVYAAAEWDNIDRSAVIDAVRRHRGRHREVTP